MATAGAWPVPWAPYSCRGGVGGFLHTVWLPWGRGRSPGFRMAAVGAWTVSWAPYGRRGGVTVFHGRGGGVIGPLRPIWLPWVRDRYPGAHMATVRAWPFPWAPCGRYPKSRKAAVGSWPVPGTRMAAVGAWPFPWVFFGRRWGVAGFLRQYGRRLGVAGPLYPVWPPWGCIVTLSHVRLLWGHGRSPGPRMIAVGVCPVPWASYGCRGGVAGPLGPVWPPCMRGQSPGPRIAAVGAWSVPWVLYGRRKAWPFP